jgi:hypothetical protein
MGVNMISHDAAHSPTEALDMGVENIFTIP